MNSHIKTRFGAGMIFISLIFSGCGASQTEMEVTPAVHSAVDVTDIPISTATPIPTITPTPVPEPMIGSVLLSQVDSMELVYIPGGIFLMGSTNEDIDRTHRSCQQYFENCPREVFEDEFPQHEVDLGPYWIDQTEVTIRMYSKCVESGACTPPAPEGYYYYSGYLSDPAHQDFPVVFVNLQQAKDYCNWAGRRLPVEAEWEKAARGTDGSYYPWGNTAIEGNLLNYRDVNYAGEAIDLSVDDGYKRLAPVGNYPAGASLYGVFDLAGNAMEWVSDVYDVYPGGDPSISEDFGQSINIARGGSWVDYSFEMHSAFRMALGPEAQGALLGFRCALTHSDALNDLYVDQQQDQPQAALPSTRTIEPSEGPDISGGSSTGECKFIDIEAYPGFVGFLSDDEMPVFGYEASGFKAGERVHVQMSGVSVGDVLSVTNLVTDRPYANGKGLIDGVLVWSEVMVGGSVPSRLEIVLEGSVCRLKKVVSWPYVD